MTRHTNPCHVLPALLIAALLLVATPALAAPDAKYVPVADLTKPLAAALKGKDVDATTKALDALVKAHGRVATGERPKLLAAIAKVLRAKQPELKLAALEAYEAIGDAAAWKHYGSLLGRPIHKTLSALQAKAMDITHTLKPAGAVKRLLVIMKKSKHLGAAAKALRTLGAYGEVRGHAKILDEIISAVIKERPGIRGREQNVVYGPRHTGELARTRWQALAGPMVAAANELTGREIRSPEAWFDVWRENRRDLGSLFTGTAE